MKDGRKKNDEIKRQKKRIKEEPEKQSKNK